MVVTCAAVIALLNKAPNLSRTGPRNSARSEGLRIIAHAM